MRNAFTLYFFLIFQSEKWYKFSIFINMFSNKAVKISYIHIYIVSDLYF